MNLERTAAFETLGTAKDLFCPYLKKVVQKRVRCFKKEHISDILRSVNVVKTIFPINEKSQDNMKRLEVLFKVTANLPLFEQEKVEPIGTTIG